MGMNVIEAEDIKETLARVLTSRQARLLSTMLDALCPGVAIGTRDGEPDVDVGAVMTMPDGKRWFFAYDTGERPFCLDDVSTVMSAQAGAGASAGEKS